MTGDGGRFTCQVHNPFDEDWNEEASDGEDEAAEPSSPTAPP